MSWLIFSIIAYFLLAVVSLFDRFFLVGSIPNPKSYAFNIGVLGFFASLLFLPFRFYLDPTVIFFGLLAGVIRILAVYFLAKSIAEDEVSRAVPTIGGFSAVFSFFLFLLFIPIPQSGQVILYQLLAFILLLAGSILISLKDFSLKSFSYKVLKYPLVSAFLYALNFLLIKKLFIWSSFPTTVFLVLLGGGLGAFSFLIYPKNREELLNQQFSQETPIIFFLAQALGGIALSLQYYSIFLAQPHQVPIIQALEGTRFLFLLFMVRALYQYEPELLKEEVDEKSLKQKVIAIVLIGFGLFFLYLYR